MNDVWMWPDTITILVSIYVSAFAVGMFTKKFRESFFNWLNLNDAFGLRFWTKNWRFSILTLLIGAISGVLIFGGVS